MKKLILLYRKLPLRARIKIASVSFGVDALFSYFFYRSMIAMILLSPLAMLVAYHLCLEEERVIRANKKSEFRDSLLSMCASLSAGYSVENSIRQSVIQMEKLYGKDSYICRELNIVCNELSVGKSAEDAIDAMAMRSMDDDIITFAQVFRFAKKSGGNMVSIMKHSAMIIDEKCTVLKDIQVLVASKKFEQKVMNIMPFGIICYIDLTMPGVLNTLYHNMFGYVFMSVIMCLYVLSYYIGLKIMDIEV